MGEDKNLAIFKIVREMERKKKRREHKIKHQEPKILKPYDYQKIFLEYMKVKIL